MARYTTPTHRRIEAAFLRMYGCGVAVARDGFWWVEAMTAGDYHRTWEVFIHAPTVFTFREI